MEVIPANSPQAKGRVERNHGVDQDRLVKELRLEGISTISGSQQVLMPETYLPKMNAKFGRLAQGDAIALSLRSAPGLPPSSCLFSR